MPLGLQHMLSVDLHPEMIDGHHLLPSVSSGSGHSQQVHVQLFEHTPAVSSGLHRRDHELTSFFHMPTAKDITDYIPSMRADGVATKLANERGADKNYDWAANSPALKKADER